MAGDDAHGQNEDQVDRRRHTDADAQAVMGTRDSDGDGSKAPTEPTQ